MIPFISIDTVNQNALVGKIDSNRQISWIKVYGGSDYDIVRSSCQTSDGGYAILSETASTNGDVTGFKGGSDLWLVRLDGSGTLLWQKCYGTSQSDHPISIATTPGNGFIILGTTNGSDSDVSYHYGSIWTFDWIVIKTDSVGNVLWSRNVGGTGGESPYGAILPVENSYYIVSSSASVDNDCTDTAWHAGVYTGDNYHVLKLDNAGNVLWDSSYGGSADDIVYHAMYDIRDSSIVINGATNSNDYMVTGFHYCSPFGGGDMWVVKVDKNGQIKWQKALGSTQKEEGKSICAAHADGYIAYGSTFPSPCSDTTIENIGQQDCMFFELSSSGTVISDKVFGGTDYEATNSVVQYSKGYVAAGISLSAFFNEGPTFGRNTTVGQEGFICYFDLKPVTVPDLFRPELSSLKTYPNPAKTVVNIEFLTSHPPGNLSILNSTGQIIRTEFIQPEKKAIEISTDEWPNGLYLIQWQATSGKMQMAKLIKN